MEAFGMPKNLVSLEAGRPLLNERALTFDVIVGAEARLDHPGNGLEVAAVGIATSLADRSLARSDRERCVRSDHVGEPRPFRLKLIARDDSIHQTDVHCFVRRQATGREQDLSCPRRSDRVDELLYAAVAVAEPEACRRHAEL